MKNSRSGYFNNNAVYVCDNRMIMCMPIVNNVWFQLLKLQGEMFEAEQNHMQEKEQACACITHFDS